MNILASNSSDAFIRRIAHRGGAWPRFWLHLLCRLFVKRMLHADADIGKLRAAQLNMDRRLGAADSDVQSTAIDCNGVPCTWQDVAQSQPRRIVLYLHGGAFMFRFPRTHARLAAGWCRKLAARTLMVDYRLAPEEPFPAAPDDCHAVYRWLLSQGYQGREIVIAGDSAGGNLTLALLHRIKAAGEPMPACAVALSPFVDFTLSGASMVGNAQRDPMFSLSGVVIARRWYVQPEQFLDPSASPLFGDFHGLPPMLIQVGSIEMLRDDAVRVATKAHASGVQVELEIWDGMPHVFQALPALPQAAAANDNVVAFIAKTVGWAA